MIDVISATVSYCQATVSKVKIPYHRVSAGKWLAARRTETYKGYKVGKKKHNRPPRDTKAYKGIQRHKSHNSGDEYDTIQGIKGIEKSAHRYSGYKLVANVVSTSVFTQKHTTQPGILNGSVQHPPLINLKDTPLQ